MTQDLENVHNQDSSPKQPPITMEPIRWSPEINHLAFALSKAQGAMRHPSKNKIAKVPMKTGGSYSYPYADLADCIDAIRKPFSDNELAISQMAFNDGPNAVGVATLIMHSSGQWIYGVLYMPCADARPQTIGSAITYGRRYALSPMTGIAAEEDDDGNLAQGNSAQTQRKGGPEPHYEPTPQDSATSRPQALSDRMEKILAAFAPFTVTRQSLEAWRGKSMTVWGDDDAVAVKALHEDLKAGKIKSGDIGARPAQGSATKSKLESAFKK